MKIQDGTHGDLWPPHNTRCQDAQTAGKDLCVNFDLFCTESSMQKTRAYRVIKVASGLLIIKMTQETKQNMKTQHGIKYKEDKCVLGRIMNFVQFNTANAH